MQSIFRALSDERPGDVGRRRRRFEARGGLRRRHALAFRRGGAGGANSGRGIKVFNALQSVFRAIGHRSGAGDGVIRRSPGPPLLRHVEPRRDFGRRKSGQRHSTISLSRSNVSRRAAWASLSARLRGGGGRGGFDGKGQRGSPHAGENKYRTCAGRLQEEAVFLAYAQNRSSRGKGGHVACAPSSETPGPGSAGSSAACPRRRRNSSPSR